MKTDSINEKTYSEENVDNIDRVTYVKRILIYILYVNTKTYSSNKSNVKKAEAAYRYSCSPF